MVACDFMNYGDGRSKYEYFLIIKFLLESGADANITSYNYERNYDWSSASKGYKYCALTFVIYNILERCHFIMDNHCNITSELDLSSIDKVELDTIKLLLEYGANPDYVDKNFFYFYDDFYEARKFYALLDFIKDMARGAELINSVKSDDLEKIKQCMGQKNLARYLGLYGRSALMYACQKGNFEVALTLISAGADINAKDENGKTVLNYAAEGGNAEIMKLLLAQGADTGTKTLQKE